MTENEKSDVDSDMRFIEPLISCSKHEDKVIFENALKVIEILASNNPELVL